MRVIPGSNPGRGCSDKERGVITRLQDSGKTKCGCGNKSTKSNWYDIGPDQLDSFASSSLAIRFNNFHRDVAQLGKSINTIMLHKHHIIPRHMGGSDSAENLILLSISEHAEAHRKLYEELGKREDYLAWKGLASQIDIEEILYLRSSIGGHGNAGKSKSAEHRNKLSKVLTGKKRIPLSEAHKQKLSIKMAGNKSSQKHSSAEYKETQRAAMKAAWAKRKLKTDISSAW